MKHFRYFVVMLEADRRKIEIHKLKHFYYYHNKNTNCNITI